jgi:fatty acid desaturase
LKWFARFMLTYSRPGQYVRIFCWVFFLQALGAPYGNVVLYVAAAPITAAVRLFYFGTYLPHLPPPRKEEEEGGKRRRKGEATTPKTTLLRRLVFGPRRDGGAEMAWQLSHTADVPPVVAFLQCLCFGYHWEHHRFPYAPWFDLPKVRALAREHGLKERCVDAYLSQVAREEVREQQQIKVGRGRGVKEVVARSA